MMMMMGEGLQRLPRGFAEMQDKVSLTLSLSWSHGYGERDGAMACS